MATKQERARAASDYTTPTLGRERICLIVRSIASACGEAKAMTLEQAVEYALRNGEG